MAKVVIVGDMTFGESSPPGAPVYPDQGLPPGYIRPPGRPDQGLPRPPRPTDPDYGVGEGGEPGHLPVWPIGPDHGLPPIAGQPLPPVNPPPGTIWPPLPPSVQPGKTLVYAGIAGVGYRYIVIEVKPPKPDQGLPGEPAHPDQGLPEEPPHPAPHRK